MTATDVDDARARRKLEQAPKARYFQSNMVRQRTCHIDTSGIYGSLFTQILNGGEYVIYLPGLDSRHARESIEPDTSSRRPT